MSTTDPGQARPTVRQYSGDQPYDNEFAGEGWVLFASMMLLILACLNVIDGIAAVSNSSFFVNDAKYILSDLNTWGWVLIATGVVQGIAAIGVFMKVRGFRWLGVAIAGLNAVAQMMVIPAYPVWSVAMFFLDMLVIYGLIAHGARPSRNR
jgi:hypothetical protein